VLREDVGDRPDGEKLTPTVLRSLNRQGNQGLANVLLGSLRSAEVRTPAGIYLGRKGIYDVKLTRLNAVAARIIKGLFYHKYGRRLPSNYDAAAYCASGLSEIPSDMKAELSRWHRILTTAAPITRGAKTFSAWGQALDEDPNLSIWLLDFYESVQFIGWTALPQVWRAAVIGGATGGEG
jgi:hypothetical protein